MPWDDDLQLEVLEAFGEAQARAGYGYDVWSEQVDATREYRRQWKAENRAEKKRFGICHSCSNPVAKGFSRCPSCLERKRIAERSSPREEGIVEKQPQLKTYPALTYTLALRSEERRQRRLETRTMADLIQFIPPQPHQCVNGSDPECLGCQSEMYRSKLASLATLAKEAESIVQEIDASIQFAPKPCRAAMSTARAFLVRITK